MPKDGSIQHAKREEQRRAKKAEKRAQREARRQQRQREQDNRSVTLPVVAVTEP